MSCVTSFDVTRDLTISLSNILKIRNEKKKYFDEKSRRGSRLSRTRLK